MAKTLDYQITLYPAHRDGAFVVTQFQMLGSYPEKRIQAAGMDDLIDKVTQFAMGMAKAAALRCAASPRANRPGSSARPRICISTWLTGRMRSAATLQPEARLRKPPGRPG